MANKTGRIRFNLTDRGHRAFGKPRHFNVAAIAAHINSDYTQERVKARNILGFYGHWPRVKFGAIAAEGGIGKDGKPAVVEPAIVTTFLQAFPDGTIEHETEFLDTDAGQVAAKLHNSRAGGFSSVIDNVQNAFIAFDYVLEPNFKANRGYSLDSAHAAASGWTLDSADGEQPQRMSLEELDEAIQEEQQHAMALVLDSANAYRQATAQALEMSGATISSLERERAELLTLLAKRDPERAATFDSGAQPVGSGAMRGVVLDAAGAQDMIRRAQSFHAAHLVGFQAPPSDKTPEALQAERVRQEASGYFLRG